MRDIHYLLRLKNTLEMLTPTTDALELQIARANYEAGIWIRADVAIIDTEVKNLDTKAWQSGTDML